MQEGVIISAFNLKKILMAQGCARPERAPHTKRVSWAAVALAWSILSVENPIIARNRSNVSFVEYAFECSF